MWTTLTDAPTPRNAAASTVADGLLYLAGGVSPSGVLRTVEHYDPAVNTWTAAPDLPIGLRDAAAVARGQDVIVLGGFIDAAATKPSARVFALRDRVWRELAPLPTARGALAAAVVANKVYAIGGRDGADGVSRAVEILDGARWTTGPSLLAARSHLAVAAGERYIYAIGGRVRAVSGAVERFDTATGRWLRRSPLGTPRAELAAIGGGTTLLAVGGAGADDQAVDAIETYSTTTDSWTPFVPELPSGLRAMGAGLIDTRLIVATGATGGTDSFTAQTLSLVVSLAPVIT